MLLPARSPEEGTSSAAPLAGVRSSGTHSADVLLRRHDLFGTTLPETLASAASSGTSGFQTRTDGSVQSPVVDNESFVYWIDLNSFQTPLGTLRLDGIVIEYTVTAPLP